MTHSGIDIMTTESDPPPAEPLSEAARMNDVRYLIDHAHELGPEDHQSWSDHRVGQIVAELVVGSHGAINFEQAFEKAKAYLDSVYAVATKMLTEQREAIADRIEHRSSLH